MLASEYAQGAYFQIEFSDVYYMYNEGEFEPDLLSWFKGLDEHPALDGKVCATRRKSNRPHGYYEVGDARLDPHDALGWGD